MDLNTNRTLRVSLFLGLFVALAVALAACGDDEPTVPEGAAAVIEHVPPGRGEITKAEVEHQVERDEIGEENESLGALIGDRGDELAKTGAIQTLFIRRWIEGEAEELGITVSDREVAKKIRVSEEVNRIQHSGKSYGPDTAFPVKADLEEGIRENALEEEIWLKIKGEGPPSSRPEFIHKWQARTYCVPEFMNPSCANSPTAEE